MRRALFEKVLNEKSSGMFRTDMTGMPIYDNMLEKPEYFAQTKGMVFRIEWMGPKEYLVACARGFGVSMSTLIQGKSELKIARIQEYLAGGHKVPMLVLEYAENGKFRGQEGRHRQ